MAHRDAHMAWMRKRVYLDPLNALSVKNDATDNVLESLRDSDAQLTEINSSGSGGFLMDNLNDAIHMFWPIPWDLDPRWDIGVQVLWTANVSALAATVTWVPAYLKCTKGATAMANPATAIDTTITQGTYVDSTGAQSTTDYLLQTSSRGILKATTHQITRDQIEDHATILWEVIQGQTPANTTNVYFLKLIVDYVPQMMWGPGSENDAPLKHTGADA